MSTIERFHCIFFLKNIDINSGASAPAAALHWLRPCSVRSLTDQLQCLLVLLAEAADLPAQDLAHRLCSYSLQVAAQRLPQAAAGRVELQGREGGEK